MRFKPTLVELCVIVSTIGVLAGLLLPGSDQDRTHRYPLATVSSASNLADLAENTSSKASTAAHIYRFSRMGGTRISKVAATASRIENQVTFGACA